MVRHALVALAAALPACGEPGGENGDAAAGDAPSGADATPASDAAADADPGSVLLSEPFPVNGSWPSGWQPLGGVASATVAGGRGRLVPTVTSYSLGRMGHVLGGSDVEVTFLLEMEDVGTQGVGFYVRQNGGYLTANVPHGSGYAVFVEGFRGAQIGVWHERDGSEELIAATPLASLDNGVVYAVRFRCEQAGSTTTLSAKIWPAAAVEPTDWTVTASDNLAPLQGAAGGVAVDAWNTATPPASTPPAIFVDDIVVSAI